MSIAAIHLLFFQIYKLDSRDPKNCLKIFKSNYLLEFKSNEQNIKNLGTAANNIGMCYMFSGFLSKGLEYYQKSLHCFNVAEDNLSITTAIRNIANYHVCKNEYDKAIL